MIVTTKILSIVDEFTTLFKQIKFRKIFKLRIADAGLPRLPEILKYPKKENYLKNS